MLEFMDEPWFGKLAVYWFGLSLLVAFVAHSADWESVMTAAGLSIFLYGMFGVVFLLREFVRWWKRVPA
jgi:hypothetical protein